MLVRKYGANENLMIIVFNILPYLYSIYEGINEGTDINVVLIVGVSTVVTIMTIVFPLLANAIESLDKRYDSTYVVDIFRKDWSVWLFSIGLCLAVCSIVFWTISYFLLPDEVLHVATPILITITFMLVVVTICLTFRIVQFKIPVKLFGILKRKEKRLVNPKHYFDRRPNKEMIKENTNFDRKSNRYYSILACLYIEAYSKGNQLQNDIINFWEKKCTPKQPSKKSLSHFSEKNISYMVSLPQCYYYFIREVEKWAHSNAEKQSPCDGVVLLTRILLTGLMPIKIEQINKQIIWTYNYETLKSVWKSMRDAINNGMESMFRLYWQTINNNALRRYSNTSLPLSSNESLLFEQQYSNNIYFLTCAFLLYRKAYDSLFYALTYTQASNRRRHVLPNSVSELLNSYVDFRVWYSDMEHQHQFSFSDDYKFGAAYETVNSSTWLTVFMFVIFWVEAKQKGEKLNGNVYFRHPKTEEVTRYMQHLLSALKQVKDNAEELEWLKASGLSSDDLPSDKECTDYIEAVLQDYEKRLDIELKKRPIIGTARDFIQKDSIIGGIRQAQSLFNQFSLASIKGKSVSYTSNLQHTMIDKRVFIQELSDTNDAINKMDLAVRQWKYQIIAQLREHFIKKVASTKMISADRKMLEEVRKEVQKRYPVCEQYRNDFALDLYMRDSLKSRLGEQLGKEIERWIGMSAIFPWQVAVVSFIPDLRTLLNIRDNSTCFKQSRIVDCLIAYRGSKEISDRFRKYLLHSVFIVPIVDLPYINWNAQVNNDLVEENNLSLIDDKQRIYVNIKHPENSSMSDVQLYKPYEIRTNNKYFIQLKLDLENVKYREE